MGGRQRGWIAPQPLAVLPKVTSRGCPLRPPGPQDVGKPSCTQMRPWRNDAAGETPVMSVETNRPTVRRQVLRPVVQPLVRPEYV